METELTKEIKKLTHTYKPKMGMRTSSKQTGRTIRYADEVWTPNGIVDSIRFEDCVISRHEECMLENYDNYDSSRKYSVNYILDQRPEETGHCKIQGETYPNKNCKGCLFLKRDAPKIGMLITAYEVKITKSDFKSKNGHNIDDPNSPIANENFYCLPKELIPEVEHMIPDHVGILSYKNGMLRQYRPSAFLDVKEETKVLLLYNALKKWCDSVTDGRLVFSEGNDFLFDTEPFLW